MPPPKQAPHVGVETIAARLDEDVEQALVHRLAVDALRRGDDDQATVGVDAVAAQDLRGLAQVGHRPVRAVADVGLVDSRPGCFRNRNDVAGQVRQRDQRLKPVEVDASAPARTRRPGRSCSAVHARSVRPSRYARRRLVGREDARLRAGLDGHVRRPRAARRSRAPRRRRRRTRAPRSSRRRPRSRRSRRGSGPCR